MPETNVCRIPVQATMQKINGEYVMVDARYAEISADKIAEFLIKKCGIDAIYGGSESPQGGDSV